MYVGGLVQSKRQCCEWLAMSRCLVRRSYYTQLVYMVLDERGMRHSATAQAYHNIIGRFGTLCCSKNGGISSVPFLCSTAPLVGQFPRRHDKMLDESPILQQSTIRILLLYSILITELFFPKRLQIKRKFSIVAKLLPILPRGEVPRQPPTSTHAVPFTRQHSHLHLNGDNLHVSLLTQPSVGVGN